MIRCRKGDIATQSRACRHVGAAHRGDVHGGGEGLVAGARHSVPKVLDGAGRRAASCFLHVRGSVGRLETVRRRAVSRIVTCGVALLLAVVLLVVATAVPRAIASDVPAHLLAMMSKLLECLENCTTDPDYETCKDNCWRDHEAIAGVAAFAEIGPDWDPSELDPQPLRAAIDDIEKVQNAVDGLAPPEEVVASLRTLLRKDISNRFVRAQSEGYVVHVLADLARSPSRGPQWREAIRGMLWETVKDPVAMGRLSTVGQAGSLAVLGSLVTGYEANQVESKISDYGLANEVSAVKKALQGCP